MTGEVRRKSCWRARQGGGGGASRDSEVVQVLSEPGRAGAELPHLGAGS